MFFLREDSPKEPPVSKLPSPFELPKPNLDGDLKEKLPDKSVFVNPYVEADNAKQALLEKHVKMISTDVKTVNGKKICWNYRKRKCRFGHNCKYAHDSDLQTPKQQDITENQFGQVPASESYEIVDEAAVLGKGKKRPGLSQTIVPGTKVMKKYYEQKTSK